MHKHKWHLPDNEQLSFVHNKLKDLKRIKEEIANKRALFHFDDNVEDILHEMHEEIGYILDLHPSQEIKTNTMLDDEEQNELQEVLEWRNKLISLGEDVNAYTH